jgi:hypothetical protein
MTLDGVTFANTYATNSTGIERVAPALPAAAAGKVTTKNSNSDGVITLTAGPNPFVAGQFVTVFVKGDATGQPNARIGMLVGAVAGLTVPVTGGHGGNLWNGDVLLGLVVEQPFTVDGLRMGSLGLASTRLVLCEILSPAAAILATLLADDGSAFVWSYPGGKPAPFAVPSGKASFSNAEPYPVTPQLAAGFN